LYRGEQPSDDSLVLVNLPWAFLTCEEGRYKISHLVWDEGASSSITDNSLYNIHTQAIDDHSLLVHYITYIPIEQLHRRRCYQKPCATTSLCLRSLLHVRLHLPCTLCPHISCASVRSALLIVRFSHQQRLRVDSIHTSNTTDAVYKA
jgi:hypothetical protein